MMHQMICHIKHQNLKQKGEDPEPLAQGYLGMVKNLNLAVTTTEQELGLLLELNPFLLKGDIQVLLNQFVEKFSELPHYKHDVEATKAYVSSLLQSNKDGDFVLFVRCRIYKNH